MKRQILALLSFVIVLGSLDTVEASSKLPPYYQNMYEQLSGNDIEDMERNKEDTSIPLKIIGPDKIVITDGDKLSKQDLLEKFTTTRGNGSPYLPIQYDIVIEKCYWIMGNNKTKYYMNGKTAIPVIESQRYGFDPTFVDIPQHIVIEATSWDDSSTARKNVTLVVKHKKPKKVNKYVYMRCEVNLHKKPNYFSTNLMRDYNAKIIDGSETKEIPYNTRVKVLEELKVGKYKWLKVKYKRKVGYIFAENASSKKLPTLKTYIHEEDAADDAYQTHNYAESRREDWQVDHNGVFTSLENWEGLSSGSKD